MPTDAQNMATAISNLTAAIVTATSNPKPNYTIDGQTVSHSDYLKGLFDSLRMAREQQAALDGPFDFEIEVT
jgi:hypothetical protein